MGSSGHDDFVPQSDWDEVPENYILSIQVPGFSKGQLRISCVLKSHIIRVQGERGPDEKGKWIRFNETYNIPQKCNVEKINAKWHDGTLIINFPKDTIIPPGTETKTQITQTQTQEEESSKGTQKTATHLPSSVPKPTQEDERLRGRQKAETKDKNNIPSGEGLSPKMDQSLDVPRPSTEKRAEEEEELQKINKKEMTDKKKEEELQNDKKKEMTEEKKERTYPDRKKKEEEEEEEELQKSKKGIRKDESVGGGGGRVTAAATAEVMEKQQLLVKIGVAVVVILSLATYISYKFGSKTRD